MIYDDMIRTGGSLIAAAQAYRDAGARRDRRDRDARRVPRRFARERLARRACSAAIVATDSHPRAVALAGATSCRSTAPRRLLTEHLISNR